MIALRVAQIGNDPSVAFCGLQFALWGADVAVFPVPGEASNDATTEIYLSANKRHAEDIAEVAAADVVLTALSAPELAALDIRTGDAIVSRITPYAEDGTLQGTPTATLLLEARSGYLSINGSPDREPVRAPANLVAYVVGASAYAATLAAVHKRLARGEVERVVTSGLDVLASITPFYRSQLLGRPDARHGGPATGVRLFPVGDGRVSANFADDAMFGLALDVLGIPRQTVPACIATPALRHQHPSATGAFLRARSSGMRAETFFRRMVAAGAPRMGLYQDIPSLLANDHMRAIGYFRSLAAPTSDTVAYPGMPAKMSRIEPPPLEPARATSTGWRAPAIAAPRRHSSQRPLAGIKIVDFTQAWIGPFATTMLADLGADVIKVESHRRPDIWRNSMADLPPGAVRNPDAHRVNLSANFNGTNRNKRDLAVDLTEERGLEVVRALIRSADIVTSNFTPRVMRRFGLDYASLLAVKPDIIAVSWSGYGETGPYADFKANGATIEAMAGWDALFGYPDDGPMVLGFYQMDAITGLQMAACALLALVHRDLTGEGQEVSGSMIEAAVPYIGEEVLRASREGRNERWGNRHPAMAPHGVYPTTGDDEWIAIALPRRRRLADASHR